MALTPEDLEQIKGLFAGQAPAPAAPEPETNQESQNQPENQPEFWVHLADGSVQVTRDSASTHMTNADGETVQVIGRYPRVVA